ncbi:MAG: hypothetical protein P8077_05970, partial [Gammaproteobacteria bacterium]
MLKWIKIIPQISPCCANVVRFDLSGAVIEWRRALVFAFVTCWLVILSVGCSENAQNHSAVDPMDIAADADANAISAKGWSKEEASAKQSSPVPIKKSSAEESPADIAEESSESDYDHGPNSSDHLMPFPPGDDGDRTPFDLWRYAGKGASSFTSP